MSKVKQISYEVEFTRNLGNFENVKPKFGLVVDLQEGEKLDDVYKKVTDTVDGWVTTKVAELEEELKALGLGKN